MSLREVMDGRASLTSEDRLEATIAADRPSSASEPSTIPAFVDRYVVDACIGSGSMGMVLRAHDPRLDRVVAIKLLHAQTASEADTARLTREAQALAKLSHPNVIDVYDVGMVDGRVFIAMEYVAGQTLDVWRRETQPPRESIVDAFIQAGRGLAAAHAAGLVHRDFKPANVLYGEDGRVRVVDFGLAAPPRNSEVNITLGSLDGNPSDVRMTATGFVVGTPAYMAPEAHCGELVDPRSDQFSFCVALFEALWGRRPFPAKTAKLLAAQSISGQIHFPPGVDVPAPLRDVVLRGLSPEPSDRWPSMEALLDRLRPPKPRAVWPWLVLGGGAVVTAAALWLLPDTSASSTCAPQVERVTQIWADDPASRVHEAFLRSEAPLAEDTWPRVRQRLDAHAEALAVARRDVCEARLDVAVAPERLDRRMACLERRTAELRGVVVVLKHADAATVRNAIRISSGLRSLQTCDDEALAAAVPPPPPAIAPSVQQAHDDLAEIRATIRAGHFDQADALARALLERIEPLDYAPLLAEVRYALGEVAEENGQYEAAYTLMDEALMTAQGAGHDALVARIATQLIFLVGSRLRKPKEAERWVRHARAAVGRLPEPSRAQTFLKSTLGNFHWARGELDRAREHLAVALAANEQDLGPHHPQTLIVRSNLAMVHHDMRDNVEARSIIERVLADRVDVYGPSHPIVASTYANLGVIEQVMGDLDAAVEHTREALDLLEASVGKGHPLYPQILINLANNHYYQGDVDEAIERQSEARDLLIESMGPREHLVGRTMLNLGALYVEVDRHDQARASLLEARSIFEEHLPPGHPELAGVINNLAFVDRTTGRLSESLAGFTEALEILEGSLGLEHPDLAGSLQGRAETYLELRRFDDALADLRRSVALVAAAEAQLGSERLAKVRYQLAETLWAAGEHVEAREEMQRAEALVDRPAKDEDDLPAQIAAWLREHPD